MSEDSIESTFDRGRARPDKYSVKLDQKTKQHLRAFYRTGSDAGLTLVADSAAYEEDDMKYKLQSQSKFWDYVNNKKRAAARMNEAEFKLMMSRYLQDDVFVKKDAAEEYLLNYDQKARSGKLESVPHAEHLVLMYSKLRPNEQAAQFECLDDSGEENEQEEKKTLITEVGRVQAQAQDGFRGSSYEEEKNIRNVKKYVKGKIFLCGEKDKQQKYLEMLERMGHMVMKEKETTNFLEATAKQIKSTNARIDLRLKEAKKKSGRVVQQVGKTTSQGMRSQPTSPRIRTAVYTSHQKAKPMSWISAAEVSENTKTKRITMAKVTARLAEMMKEAEAKANEKQEKNVAARAVGASKHKKFSSRFITTPNSVAKSSNTPASELCLFKDNGPPLFMSVSPAQKMALSIDQGDIIMRWVKNRNAVPPRVIDHSLSIGTSVISSRVPPNHTPSVKSTAYLMSPSTSGSEIERVYKALFEKERKSACETVTVSRRKGSVGSVSNFLTPRSNETSRRLFGIAGQPIRPSVAPQ